MLEKFGPADRRFVLACVAAIAVCAAIGVRLFSRAFPEAALELKINPQQAAEIAGSVLAREVEFPGQALLGASGWHHAFRFAVDDTPKVYLERTLGLAGANALFGKKAKIWRWELRWFRSGQKEEWRASVTPLGDFAGFAHLMPETAPGAHLAAPGARARAEEYLARRGIAPSAVDFVESAPQTLPRRVDWDLVFEKHGLHLGQATLRYRVQLQGDRIAGYSEFVKVPEQWERDYARLRSANDTATQVDVFFLLLTIAAMIAVLVQKTIRKDIPWKLVAGFSSVAFLLAFLSAVNGFSVSGFDYGTSSPYAAFLVQRIAFAVLSALGQAVLIAIVVAAGEPVFRERFPKKISIPRLFSRRGLRSRTCFRGIILGYALTAFFFAYQAVFYVVASRFGAWAPAEVPYDDILNTTFPWATVLFMGFFPAVSEEFVSRIFSISFLDRIFRSKAFAIVLPAFIWGFGHSSYPNQPFFIRGLEVGLAGLLVGLVFWKHGIVPILVWHFTVDATYTALLLLRSGNPYYIVSGAISAGALLVPLVASVVAMRRFGGFEPETGLTNADVGFVHAPPHAAEEVSQELPQRPLSPAVARASLLLLGPLAVLFFLPAGIPGDLQKDAIGRDGAIAAGKSFLRVNGGDPARYRLASYTATGFAEEREMAQTNPEETAQFAGFSDDAARYVLREGGTKAFDRLSRRELPTVLWALRFVAPGEKQEWKLLIDATTGRLAAFAHPLEESDPAPGSLDLESAKRRALEVAGKLGYSGRDYSVVDAGTEARPHRVDTRVVLEAAGDAVGGARPRLVAVFHGAALGAFYPMVRVPEDYLRSRESQSAFYWIAVCAKLVASAILLGCALWVVIELFRRPGFHWRWLAPPVIIAAILSAADAANGFPQLWRAYRTVIPVSLFRLSAIVEILIRALLVSIGALVGFVLLDGVRPRWTRRWRFSGSAGNSLVRAALATAGFAEAARLKAVLAHWFPASFGAQPGLASSLNAAIPALRILTSGAFRLLVIAAIASAAALAARSRRFSDRRLRVVAALLVLLLVVPLGAKSAGEAIWPALALVATLAWAGFAFFTLLSEDPSAWLCFGALAILGAPALDLLDQTARADRLQGVLTLVAAGIVILWTLLRRGDRSGLLSSPEVGPGPTIGGGRDTARSDP
jgi:hypothetical protein